MNKISGNRSDFNYISQDNSRIIIGYGLKEAENGLYEWYEVYIFKKLVNQISFEVVKDAIIADIDARTDAKILNTYPWTILHGDTSKPVEERRIGEHVTVWLSRENQDNFKEAHRLASSLPEAVIPVKFKINEEEDKTPIYDTFESFEELNLFYLGAFRYIKVDCLDAGWAEKDSVDWQPYKDYFEQLEASDESENASEE